MQKVPILAQKLTSNGWPVNAKMLRADVIAFQEVENLEAAAKVFISDRDAQMHTGFAVRHGLTDRRNPDLTELNVSGGLRHGTDITLTVGGTPIRLLSVHLKSGCWEGSLDAPLDACEKLKRQLPVVESWIDARAAEGTPFIILGDFNRRFDAPGDAFWQEIDDGKPRNSDLRYVTRGETQLCWDRKFKLFIDHIIFDRLSARWIQPFTFEQLVYQGPNTLKEQLSDHCPIAVSVRVP